MADALTPDGADCRALLPETGFLTKELELQGLGFSVIPYRWWISPVGYGWGRILRRIARNIIAVPRMAATLRRWGCDVVYTFTIAIPVGAVAAKLARLPHVWHIYESGEEDHGLYFDFGQRLSLWVIDRCSDAVVVGSDALARHYARRFAPGKVTVAYAPVTTRDAQATAPAMSSPPTRELRCVLAGALAESKGQEETIQAVSLLVRRGTPVRLALVGEGSASQRQPLECLVSDRGLDAIVTFAGFVEHVLPLVRESDVVLMCSRHEAFGRVTVEAMRAGKPVVGARSGGTMDLIRDGLNGLLYTPGSSEELAEKLEYLASHRADACRMGANGRRWAVERFTTERYPSDVLGVLERVVTARGGSHGRQAR